MRTAEINLIIDIKKLKSIIKEFEKIQKDKNKKDIILSIGFANNVTLKVID